LWTWRWVPGGRLGVGERLPRACGALSQALLTRAAAACLSYPCLRHIPLPASHPAFLPLARSPL
jgi:hypothetical protein